MSGQDMASLGLSVDSSQVIKATAGLDQLSQSAGGAGRANVLFALQAAQAQASAASFRETVQALNRDIDGTGTALDGLMRRLDQTRQVVIQTRDGMAEFTKVRVEVEALGVSFGVTSTAMEAYYRQSQQIGFTTQQTAQSLQRITEALANQTVQGQQARRVLQDYGVAMQGLTPKDAPAVLANFTAKLREFADSAQKARSASVVLGPLDPDAFGRLNDPDYVSSDEKRRRQIQNGYAEEIATRTRNASMITRQNGKEDAELADLSTRFRVGSSWNPFASGMSSADRMLLQSRIGLQSTGGVGTSSDQLSMLRYLDANKSDASLKGVMDHATNRGSTLAREPGWWSYINSGKYSANDTEIDARFEQDRRRRGTFSALYDNTKYGFQNMMGTYKPLDPMEDNRRRDPEERMLQDQGISERMAAYGDTGVARRQRADTLLRNFTVDRTTNLAGDDASKQALSEFQGVLGGDEGQARWIQLGNNTRRERDTAMVPGQAGLDQARMQAYLMSLPPEQRGQAEAYLRFNSQFGDNATLVASNPDVASMMTPGFNAPGGMTPQQSGNFVETEALTRSNRASTATESFNQRYDLQVKSTAAAKDGAAAVEALTAKTEAYNQVMNARGTDDEAKLASRRALFELDEKRRTQAVEMISNMEQQNKLESDRIAALAAAGNNPEARAKAAATSAMTSEYEQAKRNNPQLTYDEFMKQKQVATGNQATASADGIVNSSRQELLNANQLLTVARERSDVQAKYASDQKVELEFAEAIGKAQASGDQAALAAIQRRIEETKVLRAELALVNQEAKNFQMGRDLNDRAAYDRTTAGIADPQERRRRELMRDSYMDNRASRGGLADGPAGGGGMVSATAAEAPGRGAGSALAGSADSVSARKQMAWQYFLSRGDTPQVAAGRLANLLTENSSLDPTAEGDPNRAGVMTAYGIGQHHADRQAQFADMFNRPMRGASYQQQLQFYYDDPDAIWRRNSGALQGMSASGAAGLISQYQERPGDQAGEIARRGAKAEQILREMTSGQGSGRPGQDYRDNATLSADDAAALRDTANARDRFNTRQGADAAARGLAGSPGEAARARARLNVDPTINPILAGQQRDEAVAGVISGQQDQAANTAAQSRQSIKDATELAAATDRGRAAQAAATREQTIANEVRQAGNGVVDVQLRNQQLLATSASSVGNTLAADSLKTRELLEDNKKLADAWERGAGAAMQMQRNLELAPMEREIASLKEQGASVDALVARYQRLKAEKDKTAGSSQDVAIGRSMARDRDRNALTVADNDLGPLASDRSRDRLRSSMQAEQDIRNLYPDASPEKKQLVRDQAAYNQQLKESTENLQNVRDGIKEMASEGLSSMNGLILNGGKFNDVLGSMLKSWGSLLLKMAEKPLVDAGGDWFSGLLKLGGSAAGGTGGAAGATAAATPAIGNLYAAGGAFTGGVRMFAGGGLLDRPTHFFSAGGEANVAGEMGSEALMPLKRMPDGNLGIQAGGGGGGITVHAPITIQGSAAGKDGAMDPAVMDAVQKQLAEAVRVGVLQGIANEKRPGGSLY